jgi:hypothetical protein
MEWQLSRAFMLEAAKREIVSCNDMEKLKDVCLNLMLQVEAQKRMIGTLLLKG